MAIELLMTPSLQQSHHFWGIVLAGGEGKRLQNFLKTEFGQDSPKQFCTIIGRRSMLRHTIDRTASLIPGKRLLTIICRQHLVHAIEDICDRDPKTVITIPFNRETAPSILLSLMHVHKTDPQAIVAIFPSDHFILEEERFMDHVCAAFEFAAAMPEKIVTLGAQPTGRQSGYGWIEKGVTLGKKNDMNIYSVENFWEKPEEGKEQQLIMQGWLWNTMTLIGKVSTFLRVFEECVPGLFSPFQRIKNVLGTRFENEAVFDLFKTIPVVNFSHMVLEKIPHYLGVLPINNVYWNDWGEEKRVRDDVERFASSSRVPRSVPALISRREGNLYSIELQSAAYEKRDLHVEQVE